MPAHKSNSLLRYGSMGLGIFIALILVSAAIKSCNSTNENEKIAHVSKINSVKKRAASDNEAESLDILTADLNTTKKQIEQVIHDNNQLKLQNNLLVEQLDGKSASVPFKESEKSEKSAQDKETEQYPIDARKTHPTESSDVNSAQPLTTISDLTASLSTKPIVEYGLHENVLEDDHSSLLTTDLLDAKKKEKAKNSIPYYTIPANATAVHDKLMTALVGRIPVKGVVTDPYPFKIIFSDDTLAANGLRVPHLKQMIVSGFTEGDLNLKVVRGWVTSLTFVFEDGTISSTTSNDNNIGKFTKENALGYLTDAYGNPIQGTLITNAPEYLGTKVGLGIASGYGAAYAERQVNNQSTNFGGTTSTVTGSPGKFLFGQGMTTGINQAENWFDERAENSFDAIYVPTLDQKGKPIEISVNFAKEIPINYDPSGRKINYEQIQNTAPINPNLD